MSHHFEKYNKIAIKIGSALLVDAATGSIRLPWLASIAADVAHLKACGKEVLIITSGSIAVGKQYLGLKKQNKQLKLEEKQAIAAVGQIRLAHAYQEELAKFSVPAAQVLLTLEDSENRRRHLNARATLLTLLNMGIVPVINENDTVATTEIRFGDNDRLAARVAQMCGADLLILLSDINGLYTDNPRHNPAAMHLPLIETITPEIEAMASTSAAIGVGTGGMITKLMAAKIATSSGCAMIIADGQQTHPIKRLQQGETHSFFKAALSPYSARQQWLHGMLHLEGYIIVDSGAEKALRQGKSLLAAGIIGVKGDFERGDSVGLKNQSGAIIAKGLSHYSSLDIQAIMGKHSRDIPEILGYHGRTEVVHKDDYVLDALHNG